MLGKPKGEATIPLLEYDDITGLEAESLSDVDRDSNSSLAGDLGPWKLRHWVILTVLLCNPNVSVFHSRRY
jgi:hypothetical protein